MALPELIEIEPLSTVPIVALTIPGSKSITNRALVLAALASGTVTLRGALWSEDTQVMTAALRKLGFEVAIEKDPNETANRTITVRGGGGAIPRGGGQDHPLELEIGNAGTAARFLAALVCLGTGRYRLRGVPRMHERPQSGLFRALTDLGYRVDAPDGRLPAVIHGSGPRPGRCRVNVNQSSQFASALILAASAGGWEVEVEGENSDELPYVEMTRQMVSRFPGKGGEFSVEPDASSGGYFLGADALWGMGTQPLRRIRIAHWPTTRWQADAAFPRYLPLPELVSRATDLADSIMAAVVLAPFADRAVRFTDLGRLRLQECERVVALRVELSKCGARVHEVGDTLTIEPALLRGAEIDTYRDHRMAMCFAMLGLRVPGMRLRDPGCVRKTFPNFFAKLAAHPPDGLGAIVREAHTRDPLSGDRLLAD